MPERPKQDPYATRVGDTREEQADPLATMASGTPPATTPPATTPPTTTPPAGAADVRPAATPQPVARVFGEYEILDTIARGGMGVVYKARQQKLNRVVALKMILAGQFADQADIDRFYAEAEAAAQLRHPHIVGIHEVGECEGQHYFSMEYIEGQSLADLVREHPLQPRHAAELMQQIAAAMHYAHERGVLHRDLKPSNVLVDGQGAPLVTDFGLAKRAEGQSQMTMDGTVLGTPSYMPPEQATGRIDQISARSDVYSLGATLYELLVGKPPFGAANAWETIKQVKEVEPVSPRVLNPNVPADLDTISLKCLQKEANKRYATAQELADELGRFLAGEPIQARPIGWVERSVRWCRRNPRVAAASAAAVFFLIAMLATAVTGWMVTSRALRTAEASIDQMRVAIDDLFRLVADDDLLNEPRSKPLRRKLLSRARDLYRQALERLGNDDPRIQTDLARSHFQLARILRELEEPEEALGPLATARRIQTGLLDQSRNRSGGDPEQLRELRRDLGDTLNLIGQVHESLGEHEAALAVYEQAIDLRRRLAETTEDYEFERQLVNSQMNSGLIHLALRETSTDEQREAHFQRARQLLQDAHQGRRQLLERFPDDAVLHWDTAKGAYNLADLNYRRLDAVRGELDRLLVQSEQEPDRDVSAALRDLQDQEAAAREPTEQFLDEAFAELDVLLDDQAASELAGFKRIEFRQIQRLQVLCLMLRGVIETADVAETSFEEARVVLQQLVRDNPQSHEYRETLAGLFMYIGDLQYSKMTPAGDAAALASYDRAIEIWQALVDEFRGLESYERQLEFARDRRRNMQSQIEAAEPTPSASP